MDYYEFCRYQHTLPSGMQRLDDLNPYPLLENIQGNYNENSLSFGSRAGYIREAKGVRELLKECFSYFSSLAYNIILPSDVYPAYFNCVPDDARVLCYESFAQSLFNLPDTSTAVLLITNPLIPEGRYLSAAQLVALDDWLISDEKRWLIMDAVYDFKARSLDYGFASDRVIYLNSLSKLSLQPESYGCAISQCQLPNFKLITSFQIKTSYATTLQLIFDQTWLSLYEKNPSLKNDWKIPEVGYLTTININYKKLVKLNIAAIPASVFGISKDGVSVLSCISKVNDELI